MTNKTITLDRELVSRIVGLRPDYTCAQLDADEELVRAALADPVPPAGGEPEVFEPHGWAQTDGPRINAFTREFEIAEEWAMAGYGTVELLNSEHVEAEIDRLRGEHQAHVGRLQSDVELLFRCGG